DRFPADWSPLLAVRTAAPPRPARGGGTGRGRFRHSDIALLFGGSLDEESDFRAGRAGSVAGRPDPEWARRGAEEERQARRPDAQEVGGVTGRARRDRAE